VLLLFLSDDSNAIFSYAQAEVHEHTNVHRRLTVK